MLEEFIAGVLAIWLALTVIHQFDAVPNFLMGALSPWSVIPTWRFFAPNPSRYDYYILYRDWEKDSGTTPFNHIPISRSRSLWHALWNPGKRRLKVLHDSIRALNRIYEDEEDEIDEESVLEHALPYALILNLAIENKSLPDNTYRQVLVVRRAYREDEPQLLPVLLSNFYQVPSEAQIKSFGV